MTPADAKTKVRSASLFHLDPEQVRSFLLHGAGLGWPEGVEPTDLHIERVWPAGRDALAVEWSFALGDMGRFSLSATPTQTYDLTEPEVREPVFTDGILQGVRIELPDRGILVHSPDHDPALPHLVECLNPVLMSERLTGFWQNDDGVERDNSRVGVRVLSYRARRRAAFEYRRGPSRLIGKTFRDTRGERAIRWHRALYDRTRDAHPDAVAVALPVGYVPDLHLALFSWCDDVRALSKEHSTSDDLQLAMKALAWLHRTPLEDLPGFSCDDEVRIIERWRSALTRAGRTEADDLDRLVQFWQAQTPPKTRPATIHRDFYGRQVLLDDGRAVLVDLDTLACGDPALDVGNFLAHLWLDALQHRPDGAARAFETHAHQALVFYNDCGGRLDPESLKWFFASALLRLGAVHALRTTTGRCAVGLWKVAAQMLETSFPAEKPYGKSDHDRRSMPDIRTIIAEVKEGSR